MYQDLGLFIGGAWQRARSDETAPVFSPVTERALGECPVASTADTAASPDAAATLKKLSMAPGGSAPVIVYDDADLEAALTAAVPAEFANAGQVCVTGDRFFVRESLHDAFVNGFAERANACDMGLSAYAFTQSPARARRTVQALKAGMVGINSFAMTASEAPFGGTNHSGMGREGGIEGIRDYLDVKSSQMVWA